MIYSWLALPRFYLLLGAGFLMTFCAGWLFLSGAADGEARARKMAWALPEDTKEALLEDIELLKNKGFFGDLGGEDLPEDFAEDLDLSKEWRALGVIIEGDSVKLLIKNDKGDVNSLNVGDTLPDDKILTRIDKDSFSLSENGKEQEIRLYPMTAAEMKAKNNTVLDAEDVLNNSVQEEQTLINPKTEGTKRKTNKKIQPRRDFLDPSVESLLLDDLDDQVPSRVRQKKIDRQKSAQRTKMPPIPKDLLELLEEDDDLF